MLTVNLIPLRSNEPKYEVLWNSPILTINSIEYDLSLMNDGDIVKGHEVLLEAGRTDDNYSVTLYNFLSYPEWLNYGYIKELNVTTDSNIELPNYEPEEV